MTNRLFLALLVLLCASSAGAEPLRVVDGDTIRLGDVRVRLWGIDAPEIETSAGVASARFLRQILSGSTRGNVTCSPMYFDKYGRTVARCTLPDSTDIACAMVKAGHAVDWPRYSGGYYRQCER